MPDPLDTVIDFNPTMPLGSAWNAFIPCLPIEIRRQLVRVFKDLIVQHPDERVRELMHGKSVGDVLRQFEHVATPQPIASGERDGVKWTLHAPPGTPEAK